MFPVCHPQRFSISVPLWLADLSLLLFSTFPLLSHSFPFSLLILTPLLSPATSFFRFPLISRVCICRCGQLFSSQHATHLSITLSVTADKHLPADEEKRETVREGRKAGVQQLWIIYVGQGGDITRYNWISSYISSPTVCSWHVIICTHRFCISPCKPLSHLLQALLTVHMIQTVWVETLFGSLCSKWLTMDICP